MRALHVDACLERVRPRNLGHTVAQVPLVVDAGEGITGFKRDGRRVRDAPKGGVGNQVEAVDLRMEFRQVDALRRAGHFVHGGLGEGHDVFQAPRDGE